MDIKNEKINSLIIALSICHNFTMSVCTSYFKIDNLFIVYLLVLFVISVLVNKFENDRKYLIFQALALALIFGNMIFTDNNSTMKEYFLYFIAYSIIAGYLFMQKFNVKYLIKDIFLIYLIFFPVFITREFFYSSDTDLMTITYALLPGILVLLSVIFDIFEKNRLLKKGIALILMLGYGKFLVEYGSRGILIAIVIFIVLIIVDKVKKTHNKILTISCILIIGIYIKSKLYDIIIALGNILEKFNIDSDAISKTIWQINTRGTIDSNRHIIYQNALNLIKENPINGIGMGTFETKYDFFPHNVFYHIWLEWGVLICFIFFIFIVISLYLICFCKKITAEEKFISIFLFSIAIPRLLVSSVYWRTIGFWLFCLYQIEIFIKINNRQKVRDI